MTVSILPAPYQSPVLAQTDWTRVAFVTLTDRNFTDLRQHMWKVQSFIKQLACRTRSHVAAYVGSEDGNTHSHLVVAVPQHEVDRFLANLDQNPSWKRWNGHLQLETYNHTLGDRALFYVVKHEVWERQPDIACPKRDKACRKGRCPHK